MKIKHLVSAVAAILLFSCAASAVTVQKGRVKNPSVCGISFPSGASVYISASSIISISLQDYISGTISITELVIECSGGVSQLRIFHVKPVDAAGIAKDAMASAPGRLKNAAEIVDRMETAKDFIKDKTKIDTPTTDRVYKQFPQTTHAKVLEFAVDSNAEVLSLYRALLKDYAGVDPADDAAENLSSKNSLGGNLYQVESASK
jgi:hypothetical protein